MAYTNITAKLLQTGVWFISRMDPQVTFESGDRSSYGFISSAYGGTTYLASNNRGIDNSVATAKISFDFGANYYAGINLKIDYISNGESNWDYGVFSKSGMTIATGTTGGSSVYKSCYGESSTSVKTLYYYIPNDGNDGSIYINYRKDGSSSQGLDRLYLNISAEYYSGPKYWFIGHKFEFKGYQRTTMASDGGPYMLGSSVGRYITSGWPGLDSGVRSATTGNYISYWSSGLTSDAPCENGILNLRVSAYGHMSAATQERVTVVTGTTAASVRTNPTGSDIVFSKVYVQQILWKFGYWDGAMMGDYRFSHVNFELKEGTKTITAKTGNYGVAFVYSSALTDSTSNKTITVSRPGGLEDTSGTWYPQNQNSFISLWTYNIPQNSDINSQYYIAANDGIGYIVSCSAPNNAGQVATWTFIHDNIDSSLTVTYPRRAIRWADKPSRFGFDDDNYTPSTREYLCLPYIMKFDTGATSYFNSIPEYVKKWTGNTAVYTGTYEIDSDGSDVYFEAYTSQTVGPGGESINASSAQWIAQISDPRTSDGSMQYDGIVTIDLPPIYLSSGGLGIDCNMVSETNADETDIIPTFYVTSGTGNPSSWSLSVGEEIDCIDTNHEFADSIDSDPCSTVDTFEFDKQQSTLTFNALAGRKYHLCCAVEVLWTGSMSTSEGPNWSGELDLIATLNVEAGDYGLTIV